MESSGSSKIKSPGGFLLGNIASITAMLIQITISSCVTLQSLLPAVTNSAKCAYYSVDFTECVISM